MAFSTAQFKMITRMQQEQRQPLAQKIIVEAIRNATREVLGHKLETKIKKKG